MPPLLQLSFLLTWLRASWSAGTHSTQTCAQRIDRSSCLVEPSCSLSCFTHVCHRSFGCRSRLFIVSLPFVCTLLSRSASRCTGVFDSVVNWVVFLGLNAASVESSSSFRAACVCAASNSVELRFGFVRLQVKRLIFLLLLDHRNLSLHDLRDFHLFQELRLMNLRAFLHFEWLEHLPRSHLPLCQGIEPVFFNTTGTLTILSMSLQCFLCLLDHWHLSMCHDWNVLRSIEELNLWHFHRFLHGLNGANCAFHHAWHLLNFLHLQ